MIFLHFCVLIHLLMFAPLRHTIGVRSGVGAVQFWSAWTQKLRAFDILHPNLTEFQLLSKFHPSYNDEDNNEKGFFFWLFIAVIGLLYSYTCLNSEALTIMNI